ncbi:hypothetical protein KKI23_03720 [Patescibacteria group bacterium]|nr:hypothetical protein [Patescibacteria group bacterium]
MSVNNIYTTKYFEINQDWEVPIPGFMVIASLRPIKSVSDFSDQEAAEFIGLVKITRQGLKEVLKIEKVFLYQTKTVNTIFIYGCCPDCPG